jgi:phosphoribosylglycinamide formyltransferase-1
MKIGVLVSGSGSNLQAILDAERRGELGGATVALVISNVAGVRALERTEAAGVPARVIPHRDFASREAFDDALVTALGAAGVECVALAGFMRIVTARLLGAFPGRVVNIHPSLLPAFPGAHAQRQALAHGVKVSGCTVHFVDEGCDTGPILAQAAVPVLDDDDEARLAARILVEEHRIYPAALRALADGRVRVDGRRVRVLGSTT